MRRVLFLAFFFPPLQNSGTQRPAKFVKYLQDFGWDPEVVSGYRPMGVPTQLQLLDELPPALRVHRVPMVSDWTGRVATAIFGQRAGDAINWRLRARQSWPDLFASWMPMARARCRRLIRQRRYDAILATGYPWSALVLGAQLGETYGIPFVADFRDLWTTDDAHRDTPASAAEVDLERWVVKQASAVISVSDIMTDQMREFHSGEPAAKFSTVWNGFDRGEIAADANRAHRSPQQQGRFHIVYTGVWRQGYNPSYLYDAIGWLMDNRPDVLQECSVTTAGYEPRLNNGDRRIRYIKERGVLSHRDALDLMAEADLLFAPLPLGNYQKLAVPGKVFEYAATGIPIICTAAPDGECARFFTNVGGGVTVEPSSHAVAQAIAAVRTGQLHIPAVRQPQLAGYERRNQTAKLARILDQSIQ